MSTKTIGVVDWGLGWQKFGIELGSYVFHPNSSQPGMFQIFAEQTVGQTHRPTDRRTFRLMESIGPDGQCFVIGVEHVLDFQLWHVAL